MLGFLTEAAVPSAGATAPGPAVRRRAPALALERTAEDAAATAANVAQALAPIAPSVQPALPAQTGAADLAKMLSASSGFTTEAQLPTGQPFTPYTGPAPDAQWLSPSAPVEHAERSVASSAAASTSSDDDLPLYPLVEPPAEEPGGKRSTALWVGVGLLGAAALGAIAVAVARAGR